MKLSRLLQILAILAIFSTACDSNKIEEDPEWAIPDFNGSNNNESNNGNGNNDTDTPGESTEEDDYPVKYPDPNTPKVKTLLTSDFFTETQIKPGITLYSAEIKKDVVSNAVQTVFALEIDLNNEDYKVNFSYNSKSDTTSAVAKRMQAIAAVNACYELDAIYCRVNGTNVSQVTIDPDHLRFWKHEAAIVSDGKRKIGIVHGAKGAANIKSGGVQAIEMYKGLTEKYIFASAPMLIDDYDPVGARYVPSSYTSSDLSKLDGEDYRRHQGVRHPRVAAALTNDNDLLLVVVDGRFSGKASGMTCKELTNFLVKHFNPRWAINMDGGGSSTMYIDGYGDPVNNVLNYPTNNSRWDHYGQRKRPTFFLIQHDK